MILIIDNYDSFTYNIVEYYKKHGHKVAVYRNDETSIEEINTLSPSLIVLSPGPKDPQDAGITVDVIRHFKETIPIFGVCLGCQSIAVAFGGCIIRAEKMYHGKTSQMKHQGQGVLAEVQNPMSQMRYHSLIVEEKSLPPELEITARSENGEIMALRHRTLPIEGVQFHPESIASVQGETILANSLKIAVSPANAVQTEQDPIDSNILSQQQRITNTLLDGDHLTRQEASQLMQWFSDNEMSAPRIAMTLTALRIKGETADELAGIAEYARQRAVKFPVPKNQNLLDIVGTGGDARNTFNISTASAIVAAGAGCKVAKHGNRAVSSKSGSADVLEALGMNITLSPTEMLAVLERAGMCFLFAPVYHPSMKFVAPVRKELKIRTVFNILGPLVNPALVQNIVLGVYSKALLPLIADTLVALGIDRAMVVHSEKGVDEITLDGISDVIEIKNKTQQRYTINPKDYIPEIADIPEDKILQYLEGGNAQENAALIKNLVHNTISNTTQLLVVRSVIALNAGAGIYVAGLTPTLEAGISQALQSIESKNAAKVLAKLHSDITYGDNCTVLN